MLGLFRYHDTLHDSIFMASDGDFVQGFNSLFFSLAYSFLGEKTLGGQEMKGVAKLGNELFA